MRRARAGPFLCRPPFACREQEHKNERNGESEQDLPCRGKQFRYHYPCVGAPCLGPTCHPVRTFGREFLYGEFSATHRNSIRDRGIIVRHCDANQLAGDQHPTRLTSERGACANIWPSADDGFNQIAPETYLSSFVPDPAVSPPPRGFVEGDATLVAFHRPDYRLVVAVRDQVLESE